MRTKIEIGFHILVVPNEMDMHIDITARAVVVYGESLKEGKMMEFLDERIAAAAATGGAGVGSWVKALKVLEERLISRGRKGPTA